MYIIGSDCAGVSYFPSTDSRLFNSQIIFVSAMAGEMEPTANEQKLAAWLDVNVEGISYLNPDEERRCRDKIASELFWSSRSSLLESDGLCAWSPDAYALVR